MDFAGILAFSSKKRRMISSNNERRPSGYSLDGFLSRDDADPAWISCFSLTIWQMKKIMEKLDKINS